MTDRFLKLRDVIAMTGLSRTTIYRKMDLNTFPKQIVLSEACVRWRETHIVAWMDSQTQKAA